MINRANIKVSVVVPVYNIEEYIDRCVQTLIDQSLKEIEIILINDGSTDKSGEICDNLANIDSRIKVYHQENQGVSAARNIGIECANGDYIFFCDPDDYCDENLLEDNYKIAKNCNANLVIFGYYDCLYNNGERIINGKIPPFNGFLESALEFRKKFSELYFSDFLYTIWNKMYKTEYLEKCNIKFKDKKIGEDVLFNLDVYQSIDKVFLNEKKYYFYIKNRAGSAVSSFEEKKFEMRCEEVKKLEYLIKNWKMDRDEKILILDQWLITFSNGVQNLLHQDSPYNRKEINNKVIDYKKQGLIVEALQSPLLKDKPLKLRIKRYLLSNIMHIWAFYSLKLFYKLKN